MHLFEQDPDYFDQHRKDHSARPGLLGVVLIASVVLWAGIIAALMNYF